MLKITYWSDYACPYCYIGEARLLQAIKELGVEDRVELEMRAFQLDPYAPATADGDTVTRFAVKYRLSREDAARKVDTISQMGRRAGLEFNYATTLFTNTMDAHRLTKWVAAKGDSALTQQVIHALFHAYFAQNLELASHEVLLGVAKDCGLDEAEVRQLLAGNEFEAEVRRDQADAAARGVSGVPFFVAGRYEIPGALATGDFKKVLRELLAEQDAAPSLQGGSCGPDGCELR